MAQQVKGRAATPDVLSLIPGTRKAEGQSAFKPAPLNREPSSELPLPST